MLQVTVDWLVYSLFGFNKSSNIGPVINFFIYDSIKIIILLFVMISVMGFLRTYMSQEKTKKWLIGKGFLSYIFAALFGALTPFCSCSSIPIFIGFLEAGVPLGILFSFLVTSPLVNEYLVVLMFGFFGWKITVLYVLFGVVIGITSGLILGKMKLEKNLVKDLISRTLSDNDEIEHINLKSRITWGMNEALNILKKLWIWILIGVGIGAVIHNYVPQETIQAIISKTGVFSVPLAVLLGTPMYGSCAAIVPIAVVLFQKGIPLGTALAFMMATSALSLPEAVILRRVMNLKLIGIFFVIVVISIILVGYLINFIY
ncbi:permease [Elusimicrobiota bacterium]